MLTIQRKLLPSQLKNLSISDQIKTKFLVVNASSTFIWGPALSLMLLLMDAPYTSFCVFIGFLISVFSIYYLNRTAKTTNAALIFIIGTFLMLLLMCIFNRGADFGGVVWMIIIPLIALHSIGRKAGFITLSVACAMLISLKIVENLFYKFPTELSDSAHDAFFYISIMCVCPIIFSIGSAYRGLSHKALIKQLELNETKTKFISNVSHELRTPLNGIIGILEILKHEDFPKEFEEYIQTIDYSSKHLLEIVNEILELSDTQTMKIKFTNKPYSLRKLINKSLNTLRPLAAKKSINLAYEISDEAPDNFFGDSKRVNQLLLNFVGNSIKFTEKGSVELRIRHALVQAHEIVQLKFTIKDTGIGIPPDKINRLFDPFYQVDNSSTRAQVGSGLGLAICKQIIEALEGNVNAYSQPGEGSIFKFTINQRIDNGKRRGQVTLENQDKVLDLKNGEHNQSVANVHFEDLKILVAEDNAINQLVICKILKQLECNVSVANNGQEVLNLIDDGKTFDLIFMDGQMPVLNGFDTTEKLRQDYQFTLPIIAVTAGASEADKLRCINSGMNSVITKPVKKIDLENAIRNYCR